MATIVIAADGSEAAHKAAEIGFEAAKAWGDRVVLVTAWEVLRADFGMPVHLIDRDFLDAEKEWGERVLRDAAEHAAAHGIEAETLLVRGEPASEVCRVARERRARMIVVGTHGWGTVRSLLLGSVTLRILHHAPCAVLTGPPSPPTPLEAARVEHTGTSTP
jgi:nucleotide-binding universal stress UspA family protein